MEESVRAAFSFIRSHLEELGLNDFGVDVQTAIGKADLHVHFPAGKKKQRHRLHSIVLYYRIISTMQFTIF